MNPSSALLDSEISEEAAVIADASLIVRGRFVEAADTMANIDVGQLRPSAVRSFWPEHRVETIGGHHPGYKLNGDRLRHRPSRQAISRAEEVMYGWLLELVDDDERRILLGKWSMCLAAPRIAGSFRQFCKKTGRSRSTAERRLTREFAGIADAVLKNAQSLHEPNWSRVMPMLPNTASHLDMVRPSAETTPRNWIAPDAILINDPDSPERKALVERLERQNVRRQREATRRSA